MPISAYSSRAGPRAAPLYESIYRAALAVDGEYSPSWYNMGVFYGERGDADQAAGAYLKALEFCPDYTEALCNYGALLRTQNKLEGAIEAFEKSLRLCPNHAMIRGNLAATLCELGAEVKHKGSVSGSSGCDRNSEYYRASLTKAIHLYERAMALEPKHPLVLYNLGVAYAESGERHKSVAMYELTTHFAPACAEAWNNLGVLLRDLGNMDRAIECYQTAARANPKFGQPLNNLGIVYASKGCVKDSLQSFQAAIESCPSYAEVYNNLGVLYRDVGQMQDCLAAYRKCIELDPQNRSAGHNLLMGLNYVHSGEEETLCEAHREWGEIFSKQYRNYLPELKHVSRSTFRQAVLSSFNSSNSSSSSEVSYQDESEMSLFEHHAKIPLNADDPQGGSSFELAEKDSLVVTDPDKDLTVGYISPDLFTHSVSYFAEAPLTHHTRVNVIVYNVTPAPDAKTDRLRRLCRASVGLKGTKNVLWRDVAHLSELNLAKLVRKDGVDILVELTGHTANNRLAAMAMKPAPIQATWIGYPNSTGLREVDYRITDEITDPKDTKQTYVEKLERLPGCFLCYTPAVDAPPVEALPVLSTGVFTFGTFNALAKVTSEVVALWACILREVPHSRLLIKSKPFLCETGRQRTQRLFQSHGIDLDRVDLIPLIKSNHGHLAVYHHVDLALDPFPYAGTTTTCEALYMGVPSIIPAWGGGHAQLVGSSLMQSVLGESQSQSQSGRFIARSKQEYLELAVHHSRHLSELAALRSSLREKMLSSPLCQAKPFVSHLETVYRKWWKTLCYDREKEREREHVKQSQVRNAHSSEHQHQEQQPLSLALEQTNKINSNERDHLTASEENNLRENVKRICLQEPDCSSDCSSDQTSQLNC
jgi:predicted O-linked N-acetylglucosamine transferase (SPINDLY family)